jgi:hypothetical protein
MRKEGSRQKGLTEEQVDDRVVAEADVDSAWRAPVVLKPGRGVSSAETRRKPRPHRE